MAYTPISKIERKELGGGSPLLPPGAYICIITDARLSKSKKGDMALLVTWDVAEGEHKGHFGGAEFGHTEWLMLEGGGAPYAAARLDKVTAANSVPPVSFDAAATADAAAAAYDQSGRIGEMPVPLFIGRAIGLVVGIEESDYKGSTRERNFVDRWITPDEVRAGKYTDSKGAVHDVRIPEKRVERKQQPTQPAQATQDSLLADEEIPF